MDRATIVATTLALREWLELDHEARWAGYRRRAVRIIDALNLKIPAALTLGCFTLDERLLDEPVNAVVIRPDVGSGHSPTSLATALASGTPSIRAISLGDELAFCLETVFDYEDELLIERISAAFSAQP